MFSISEISKRSGIPARKLRYVVDHELGPFREDDSPETVSGSARRFSPSGATLIVCAAQLLESGIKKETVHDFLWTFDRVPARPKVRSNLDYFISSLDFDTNDEFRILFADSSHIRCIAGKQDSQWLKILENKFSKEPGYIPTTLISVNLHRIQNIFRAKQK